ncbi:hypothetical protein BpHYR1_005204 [Brachionus plicatilis]|uniref:Uncharacterized protein n=1 Tax=Brachionus plicatilis TaxID=10195 RepID=A0A3M7PAD8_BRAPC|nr:hypothetical protein BpHYR1_005204 [Brachionus plicatilis]
MFVLEQKSSPCYMICIRGCEDRHTHNIKGNINQIDNVAFENNLGRTSLKKVISVIGKNPLSSKILWNKNK